MEKYIGTKMIEATPMNLGDYNNYRNWIMPDNEDPNREGYLVKYSDNYESWSPKETFEESYQLTSNMSFGQAFEAMKMGFKVKLENDTRILSIIGDQMFGSDDEEFSHFSIRVIEIKHLIGTKWEIIE